ncbi:hypothetical protein ACHAW6_006095, partial [Cyclotella cf. meneghiniana]
DKALSKLKVELSKGLASIPTLNGGGHNGHIGLIIPNAEYITFACGGTAFDILDNPRPYHMTVNPDAVVRERQIAEHNAKIKEYEMQLGVTSWARKAIVSAVNKNWLSELRSKHVGFNHKSPFKSITHLESIEGDVDFMDVTELQGEVLKPWDQVEAPATLFKRQDKIEKQLVKAEIQPQTQLRLLTSMAWFQESGKFDSAFECWKMKPARLNKEGYFKSLIVPGLWKHKTQNDQFVLVVDDFGIKYLKKEDLDHLIGVLKTYYDVSGKESIKIEFDWDYDKGEVHLSMEPYLQKALPQFDNAVPKK